MRRLSLCSLLLTSLAAAQGVIPIPAYNATFSSATLTRGFWFQSPGPIVITGLEAPDELMVGTQNFEVFRLAAPPPAWPASATGGQIFYSANQPSGQILSTTIPVQTGDLIGILGACGTTMMNNSQGSNGPFTSSILGQPVTLERFLTQTNINTSGGDQPYSQEAAAPVVRVEVHYVPAAGLFPNFTADTTAGLAPLTVNFTDLSFTSDPMGILAWQWDFDGDGNVDSSVQHPTHVFNTQGTYDVTLIVVDPTNGLGSVTKSAFINVTRPSPSLQAVAELSPGSGTLSGASPQVFSDGWDLRWNLLDTTGTQTGRIGAVIANYGVGRSAPLGATGSIPGFSQVWAGSTPAGAADVWLPFVIGGPEVAFTVPPGLFMAGDTVRLQGIMLDPQAGTGRLLPATPTLETIEFRHQACRGGYETFDSLSAGIGVYPATWTNGGGAAEWRVNSGPTGSTGTGPTRAVSGSNYMYCETSSPVAGRRFIMNTGPIPTAGLTGTLDFELSRVGATIGTLEIRQDDGSGTFPILLGSYTGPDPAFTDWTPATVNLQLQGLSTVQLQFNYAQGVGFTGDIAIDNVCIN